MLKKTLLIVFGTLLAVGIAQAATVGWTYSTSTNSVSPYPNSSTQVIVTATSTLATTTTSVLNGVIVVDGVHYARTPAGINAALNQCGTNGIGEVLLPSANYAITSTIFVPSDCILTGQGSTTLLTLSTGATVKVANASNVTVQYIHTEGAAQVSGDYQLFVLNAHNIHIDHNDVLNSGGFGIFIDATSTASTSLIWETDNNVSGLGNNDVIGGGPDNYPSDRVSDITIENNQCYQHAELGNGYQYCIDITGVNRTSFVNNRVHGAVAFGSEQFPNQFSMITGNIIETATTSSNLALISAVTTAGATTQAQDSIQITNNILNGGYLYASGAVNGRMPRFLISGNTITARNNNANSSNGLWVRYCIDGLVANNVVRQGGIGVLIDNCNEVNVTNNNIADAGTFGVRELTSNNDFISNNIFDASSVAVDIDYSVTDPTTVIGINYGVFTHTDLAPTITNLTGKVSIGSSTPFSQFTIHANNTNTLTSLFTIASSTSNSTTTLFNISNTGNITTKLVSGLVGNNNGLLYSFASSSLFGYIPLNPTRNINTNFPIGGGGNLSSDLTLTFGGLSTSTAAVQGNIPYFSGVNTFANEATGSITCTGNASCGAGSYVLGNALTINDSGGLTVDPNWNYFQATGGNYISPTSTSVGIGVFASSTIGNGSQTGGLLISGFSTTTGKIITASGNTPIGDIGVTSSTYTIRDVNGNGIQFLAGFANTGNALLRDGSKFDLGNTSNTNNLSVSGNFSFGDAYKAIAAPTNGGIIIGTVGIGTSSPFAKLSIHANNGDTNQVLFAIGSSTQSATTTLFSISNTGLSLYAAITSTLTTIGGWWFDATQQAFAFIAGASGNGVRETVVGSLYTLTTQNVVANTSSETSSISNVSGTEGIGTTTIPASFFVKGKTIEIKEGGVYSTKTITPGNLTIKVKLGSTVLASETLNALASAASGAGWDGDVLVTCELVSGNNCTFSVAGHILYAVANPAATNLQPIYGDINNSGNTVSAAINTAQNIDITLTWATADIANIATTTAAVVDTKN